MVSHMRKWRGFILISIFMAVVISAISSISQEAMASFIASRSSSFDSRAMSEQDMAKVEAFLESRIVIQKLADFGMSKEEATAKVNHLQNEDLHTLASIVHSAPAGGNGIGFIIGVAVLVVLFLIILKLLNKEVIIR